MLLCISYELELRTKDLTRFWMKTFGKNTSQTILCILYYIISRAHKSHRSILNDDKFDHLVKIASTRPHHCKDVFSTFN